MQPDKTRRALVAAPAALAALATLPGRAFAQADAWPNATIDYLVPFAAGGLSDLIGRMIGEGIQRRYKQSVINDIKVGAAGAVAIAALQRAKPDGNTLMAANNGIFAVGPFLYKIAYDPLADIIPVALTGDAYMAIVIHPSVPAKTLPELIAYAKANPGKLNYGSAGLGTVSHLSGEYLKKRTGIDIVHIPYKGSPAAVQACLANDVQVIFGPEGADASLVGKLRAIAILGKQRWSRLPDVATTEEAGLANWGLRSWHTVLVPGKTPPATIARINQVLTEIVMEPDHVAKLRGMGLEPAPHSLAELAQRVKDDRATFGALIRELGITGGEPT